MGTHHLLDALDATSLRPRWSWSVRDRVSEHDRGPDRRCPARTASPYGFSELAQEIAAAGDVMPVVRSARSITRARASRPRT